MNIFILSLVDHQKLEQNLHLEISHQLKQLMVYHTSVTFAGHQKVEEEGENLT